MKMGKYFEQTFHKRRNPEEIAKNHMKMFNLISH